MTSQFKLEDFFLHLLYANQPAVVSVSAVCERRILHTLLSPGPGPADFMMNWEMATLLPGRRGWEVGGGGG